MPVGIIGITTDQARWALVQFRVNSEGNNITVSIHSYDTSSRTSNVGVYVAFIKVS